MKFFKDNPSYKPTLSALKILKYIGPGLLVTVGFIDPGNWASNVEAGSAFGLSLLWVVTLATIMLIILQHNAAHLGIVTGECLSENIARHFNPFNKRMALGTAVMAAVCTALAEILGGAIALEMLFKIPLKIGAIMILVLISIMLVSNSYHKLERWIIAFVSLIGLSFIIEIGLVKLNWMEVIPAWFVPSLPHGSILIVMSVLGAVVMPHNLYLHSEVIQSRQWNLEDEAVIKQQLKYEFMDTLFSMMVGWAINSAMILIAAATFFGVARVTSLTQAQAMLKPLLGSGAAMIFALALFFAGVSSSITAGMAGGSIYAGFFGEPFDIKDNHSRMGVFITLVGATLIIFLITDPYQALVISQMMLSIQLPFTIFPLIVLTSNEKVMGKFKNTFTEKAGLWLVGIVVTLLNLILFADILGFIKF
jgi:manganese transport protein